jgi:hypothetical protein
VNHFHAAGGMAFVVRELLKAGLVHEDVQTVAGEGLEAYAREPFLEDGVLVWREGATESLDTAILRPVSDPFSPEGGLRLLAGGLGRGVIKVSAVKPEHQSVTAPRRPCSRAGRLPRRLQARRAGSRRHRRRPLPGPVGQRHARAAQPVARPRSCSTAATRSPWSPTAG